MDSVVTTPQQSTIMLPSAQGAVFRVYHTERTVMIYPIDETGMKHLSLLNNLAAFFSSLAVGTGVKAYDLVCSLWIESTPTDQAQALVYSNASFFVLVSVLCGVAAVVSLRARVSEVDRIKQESRRIAVE